MRATKKEIYTFTEVDELDLLELLAVLSIIFDRFYKILRETLFERRSVLSNHISYMWVTKASHETLAGETFRIR